MHLINGGLNAIYTYNTPSGSVLLRPIEITALEKDNSNKALIKNTQLEDNIKWMSDFDE